MLFMVAALLLSFPRVWLPRARRLLCRPEPGEGTRPHETPHVVQGGRPGRFRGATLVLHVARSSFAGFPCAARDAADNAEASNHAGRGSRGKDRDSSVRHERRCNPVDERSTPAIVGTAG